MLLAHQPRVLHQVLLLDLAQRRQAGRAGDRVAAERVAVVELDALLRRCPRNAWLTCSWISTAASGA